MEQDLSRELIEGQQWRRGISHFGINKSLGRSVLAALPLLSGKENPWRREEGRNSLRELVEKKMRN